MPRSRPSIRRRRPIRRWLGRALALAALALVAIQGWYLGWVVYYAAHDPGATAFMELRRQPGNGAVTPRPWIGYERISPWLKRAVVAAEDARFAEHGGIDWQALGDALEANLAADGVVRGGSTITQQLAKNLFLSPRRSYARKAQEAAIALMIEAVMDKRRILELYLNVIEWGDGVFGAEAAARHYYDRGAGELTRWQAAMLAARIPRPRYYDRNGVTPYLLERAERIHAWSRAAVVP